MTPVPDTRRLIVMDVDSTFITQEVIELLAARAGAQEEVARVTEAAMRGEIDFADSLRARVATLAGLPATVLEDVLAEVTPSDGIAELVAFAGERGWPLALVSGGFIEIVAPLAASFGITRARANALEVHDGVLTGRVAGPVIDRSAKAAALTQFAAEVGLSPDAAIAIGDGANDLEMMAAAGLSIAYCAKPVVAVAADHAVGTMHEVIDILR
ncbi:phosphoserine phosphatase SerB [Serinibacter salmoneus]|uniref:phosphoserine phosphatase n=1 Tax=Serinibacter salmoneus TaxID=556530 RepID=A0A2A9D096_9MICO|nr:phosphoserine phosphatase SerB [Serinibacter salmoneus]PFG19811.1 phosphoserine phosphatase [Serinibacter salmoneus]